MYGILCYQLLQTLSAVAEYGKAAAAHGPGPHCTLDLIIDN